MTYHLVVNWAKCIALLEKGIDTVGVTMHEAGERFGPRPYWSGNFWWATTEFLKTLPPVGHRHRYDAEGWTGDGSAPFKYHEFEPGPMAHLDYDVNLDWLEMSTAINDSPDRKNPSNAIDHVEPSANVGAMKIAVYTITKNEEQFIARWAESCKDADYRLIVDTGSSDRTTEVARENQCDVAVINVNPWRFDDARNAALALIPADVDWCISLDADEVLQPGWRQHMENLPKDVTRPRYKYVWSWNPDGSEGLVFYRDHIHRRHGYRWKHPVHEILVCTGEEKQAVCGLEVHHHPDPSKSRSQYLPLLELAVAEDPEGDRNMFYLGRELVFNGRLQDATPYFLKHLKISTWDAERSASMRYLAQTTGQKEHWLLRACAEAPGRREPWVDLARFYYEKQQWAQCYSASQRAISIVHKPLDYICEAEAWGPAAHDLCAIASWNIGLTQESLGHSQNALNITPSDVRLRSNVAAVIRSLRSSKVDVIVPTKSNIDGLRRVCEIAINDPSVANVFVIADGRKAYELIQQSKLPPIKLLEIEEGSGIQAMWNKGLQNVDRKNHVCFLNDDVQIDLLAISTLASQLDVDSSIGLICPNYDDRFIPGSHQEVRGATGVYGKTGIAGASMMLRSSLALTWRFDEKMKWYFGDDDLAMWTLLTKNKKTVVSGLCRAWGNESWTTVNDPPLNFKEDTDNDKKIFDAKWGIHDNK